MKFLKALILLMIVLMLQSCDYYQKKIGENYFVGWINLPENSCIGFGSKDANQGIICDAVFEVHWNDEYILAKRHPLEGVGIAGINKDSTEYYILKKVKFGEAKASQNMYGPFSKEEYNNKKEELGLEESEMESITFDDLK